MESVAIYGLTEQKEDEMRDVVDRSFAVILAVLVCGVCFAFAQECAPSGGLDFICGPAAVEDLVRVPATQWMIGSGMSEPRNPGKLHLIDAGKKTWEVLYPGQNPQNDLDAKSYPACPGAPDAKTFGAHGIAIRDDGSRSSTVLAVNHGREAIEVFKVKSAGGKPSIQWIGCVPMGENNYINSVAFLPGGGFVATKYYDPKAPGGFGSIFAGGTTGGVLEWHPETGVKPLPGTDLAGANGIEVSKDGRWIYVAAWGSQEVVRFSHGNGPLQKKVAKVGFCPDNFRWAPDGKILVAGQNTPGGLSGRIPAFKGWTVGKLDPETLMFTEIMKDDGSSTLQNVSVALEVDGTIWLGVFRGDRVAYKKQ
jgi:hypothetical protein